MDGAHVVAAHLAACVGHAAHGVGALQGHDLGTGLVQLLGGDLLAGDGGEELRLEVQVAAVVAGLGGAHRHGPHPVAQGERVVQDVCHNAPPHEVGLVLVHGGVEHRRVDGVLAAPELGCDGLLDVERQAAALEVHRGVDHVVAVEQVVVEHAHLAEAFLGVVHRPAARADEARGHGVEPLHVVPALGPGVGAVGDVGELGVVLRDEGQQLGHEGGVVLLELGPVKAVVLAGGQHALEHTARIAVGDIAVELRVVAPQAQVVDDRAHDLVPDQGVFRVVEHGGLVAQDGDHVLEGEVGHAGVARDLVAAVLLGRGDAHVRIAVDGAAVAAVHLDGVLLCLGAVVLGGLHAAVAHGVKLTGLGLAGLDGAALCLGPVEALARGPAAALVVEFRPLLLGGGHHVVVVGADDVPQHVVGELGDLLRVLDVDRAGAPHDQGLHVLGAQHGGGAGAGGVVARVDDAGVGQQVLAGGADGGHAAVGALQAA